MPQNEEPSTQNHDWDDADPGIKQRFQEPARKDTEHRTKFSALPKETLDDWRQKDMEARAREDELSPDMTIYHGIHGSKSPDTTICHDILEPSLHDDLREISDLLDLEEDYTND